MWLQTARSTHYLYQPRFGDIQNELIYFWRSPVWRLAIKMVEPVQEISEERSAESDYTIKGI